MTERDMQARAVTEDGLESIFAAPGCARRTRLRF